MAGKEARVTCNVSAQVPPPGPPNLHLTLWGGGLPPSTNRGPSVRLDFTAQPEQHGREVTCEAVLRLGRRTVNASTAVTLRVWGEFGDGQMGGNPGRGVEDPLAAGNAGAAGSVAQALGAPRSGWSRHQGGEERGHPAGLWVPLPCHPPLPAPAAPHDVRVWAPRTVFTAGDNLTVMCRAEGNPPPRLRWELPTNASRELRDGGTTVTIPAAQRAHGGTYRCLAENRYGASAASIKLLFQGEGCLWWHPVTPSPLPGLGATVRGWHRAGVSDGEGDGGGISR